MTCKKHGPSDNGDHEDRGFRDEFEGSIKMEEGINVQEALMVGHIYNRPVRGGQILSPLDFNPVEERGAYLGPDVVHKVLCEPFVLVHCKDEGRHYGHDDKERNGEGEAP